MISIVVRQLYLTDRHVCEHQLMCLLSLLIFLVLYLLLFKLLLHNFLDVFEVHIRTQLLNRVSLVRFAAINVSSVSTERLLFTLIEGRGILRVYFMIRAKQHLVVIIKVNRSTIVLFLTH